MVKNLKPRDSVEAMLVAQMVSVHVMAIRCAQQLATADDLARRDGGKAIVGSVTQHASVIVKEKGAGAAARKAKRARRRRGLQERTRLG
jgi:hypothetical protein